MANSPHDAFDNQRNKLPRLFEHDLLANHNEDRWPRQIEFVATEVSNGTYPIGLRTRSETRNISSGHELNEAAADHYLTGLRALVDSPSIKQRLPDDLNLGQLLVEFSELREGLSAADSDIPPGEVLARLTTRELRRQTGEEAQLAHHIQPDVSSAHELVAQLSEMPELATQIQSALPDASSGESLTDQLGQIDVTTELWDHQLEALASWIDDEMTGYVNMATATGKTVLGLAAVAHSLSATDSANPTSLGSLHPTDKKRLAEACDGTPKTPSADRSGDVLIVTTDNLLGVQWARLFQEHCQTPPEYTKIEDRTITLPNINVDIRSAASITDIDPSDYRIAVFDEVHNYSDDDNWGKPLRTCINSDCPVLALTGSVTDQLETLAADTEADFVESYTYTHKQALEDGVIPNFEWSLTFTGIQTDTDVADRFRETTVIAESRAECTPNGYALSAAKLAETDPDLTPEQRNIIAGEYDTPSQVAAALRSASELEGDTEITDYVNGKTAPTEELESLAHGLDTRTLDRMNLRASLDRVVSLAESAMEQERPTLILTRSYKEAKTLWQDLYDRNSDRKVMRFKRDQSSTDHADMIAEFDEVETDCKILIAPGKYIGQGKDIQSIEVGINLSKQGTGMSASLVQRLGRLLRNAGEKNTVEFYHVIGTPPADTILPTDGKSFVQTASEFFGQVVEPDTRGILKPPNVIVDPDCQADLIALETIGAPTLREKQVMTDIEAAYVDTIISMTMSGVNDASEPTVTTDWFSDVYADYEYVGPDEESEPSLISFSKVAEASSEQIDESTPEDADGHDSQSVTQSSDDAVESAKDEDSTIETGADDENIAEDSVTKNDAQNDATAEKTSDPTDFTPIEIEDTEPDLDAYIETETNKTADSSDNMIKNQSDENGVSTHNIETTVTVDRSVAALIELTVGNDDSKYESSTELIEAALDPFVKSLINSEIEVDSLEYTDSDTLSLDCGPALEEVLTRKLSIADGSDEASQLLLDGLFKALDIDADPEIAVPSYSKYQLGIETLVENPDSAAETPGEVVQIAIEDLLDVRDVI